MSRKGKQNTRAIGEEGKSWNHIFLWSAGVLLWLYLIRWQTNTLQCKGVTKSSYQLIITIRKFDNQGWKV